MTWKKNDDTRVMFFDREDQTWVETQPKEPTLKIVSTKVWSYRDSNTNSFFGWDETNEKWIPLSREQTGELSGLEQGHVYESAPREDTEGVYWIVTSKVRIVSTALARFGLNEAFLLRGGNSRQKVKPDYVIHLTNKTYIGFRNSIRAIGGVVEEKQVDMDAVEKTAAQATLCRAQTVDIIGNLGKMAEAPPETMDTGFFETIDQLVQTCRTLSEDYEHLRKLVLKSETDLQSEPGRIPDKARLAALVQEHRTLKPMTVVNGIVSGILDRKGKYDAHQQAPDPAMSLLHALLIGMYGAHHGIVQPETGEILIRLDPANTFRDAQTIVFDSKISIIGKAE